MNDDALEQFHHDRRRKYIKGVNEHRNGNAHAPFAGDLVTEYMSEQVDSVNYLEEDYNTGKISWDEFKYASDRHFELWNWRRQRG